MHTNTEENYLKTLFNIANEKGEVSVNDLSRHLGIKMPTVNSMVKKLSEKKLVIYESYKPVRLTEKGKREAGLIIRKHRLTEMYLVDQLGFGWDAVHEIAEQIEHIKAPLFFDKIDELLGYPKVDPHGSPIPDKNGKIEWLKYIRLSDCKVGETVIVRAVIHSSNDFLKFLDTREMRLGLKVKIRSIEDFDGTMTVSYGKRSSEHFSRVACERLLVENLA